MPRSEALFVVGRDRKKRVCARLRGDFGKPHGTVGAVGTATRKERNPPRDALMRHADQFAVLVKIQRCALACRSRNQNCRNSARDLEFDQRLQCGAVDFSVPERGNQRGCRAFENGRFV